MTQKKRLRKQNVKKTNDEKTHKEQNAPATMQEVKKYLQDQLFNNEMIKQARESMTPEQLEEYKKKGEEFFANVDFEDKDGNAIPPVESACAYITEGLKSGMHPSYLDDDEKRVMEEIYGKEWYKKWGWESLEF
tara:strand:- start:293 stop:694 length:402 start_codon:yes stop_codon:yes gene_type:complete